MNRELKFRVWDKKNNHWASVRGLLLNRSGPSKIYSINHPEDLERFTFQQFTGLKDKSGKEIYEGDIVKTVYNSTGEVIFDLNTGAIRIVVQGKLVPIITYRFTNGEPQGLMPVVENVVGNIFENPELCAK